MTVIDDTREAVLELCTSLYLATEEARGVHERVGNFFVFPHGCKPMPPHLRQALDTPYKAALASLEEAERHLTEMKATVSDILEWLGKAKAEAEEREIDAAGASGAV